MRPDRVQIEPAGVTAGKSFSGSNTLLKKFVTLGRFFSYARAASRDNRYFILEMHESLLYAFFNMISSSQGEDTVGKELVATPHSPGRTPFCAFTFSFVVEQGIELHPRHVGPGDVRHVTTSALAHRRFRGRCFIGHGMMSESEKAPSVGLRKTPGIFHGGINAVKWPIEETPPGRFCSGAVRERRVKNQGQLFYNERAFRERFRSSYKPRDYEPPHKRCGIQENLPVPRSVRSG